MNHGGLPVCGMALQEADDGVADAGETKLGGIDLADRYPESLSGVVGGTDNGLDGCRVAVDGNEEIHVDGMNAHAAVLVDVGRRELIDNVGLTDLKARFFLDLAAHAFLDGLVHIDKTTGQVEGALGRLLGSSHDEHLVQVIDDEGCRGGTRIGIVDKPAVATTLALEVVHLEVLPATDGAALKFL